MIVNVELKRKLSTLQHSIHSRHINSQSQSFNFSLNGFFHLRKIRLVCSIDRKCVYLVETINTVHTMTTELSE